jgi:hypothetical protein
MEKADIETNNRHRPQRPASTPTSGRSVASHHYQVIILGDCLASRIAGVILAKRGCRILTLQGKRPTEHPWFQSSFHLEQLLESLGGRACFIPPTPFQVLTEDCRFEINGSSPLEEELRREFPARHKEMLTVLARLDSLGKDLEKVLWRCGGLPFFGAGSRLKFTTRRLFSGLVGKGMMRPLSEVLLPFADDPSGVALNALFAGLAMTPPEALTVAEGALLWSNATSTRNISPSGLDDLLGHRYEQFHGEIGDLAQVQSLDFKGNNLHSATLHNGARCSADHFILGSPEALPLLPEKLRNKVSGPPRGWAQFTAALDDTLVSSHLAPRVILAGSPPLRLTLTARENQIQCSIGVPWQSDTTDETKVGEIVRRLSLQLFPFARFDLQAVQPLPAGKTGAQKRGTRFLGASNGMRLRGNLLLCHGPGILPSLAATGEVLAGFSAAGQIYRRLKPVK